MNIETQIRDYIIRNILFSDNGFQFGDNDSFLDGGIVDSFGVMELVKFSEDNFEIRVEDQEIVPDNFDSVSKLANFVRTKQSYRN
jgi:acyl carrier protein